MATTGSSSTTSDNDEAVLLREWNFEKFFPERSSMSQVESLKMDAAKNNLAYQEKRKIEDMNNQLKLENRVKNAIFTKNNNEANSKLLGDNIPPKADSRFTNFVRGFRRENTDFFAHTKRHSAVFGNEQPSSPPKNTSPQKMQRSSAIFQRNRPKGEPVLTDFAKRDNSLGKMANLERPQDPVRMRQSNNLDLHRLRREKTESVIFVRNSPFNPPQQVKAEMMGNHFCKRFFLDPFFMLIVLSFVSLKHVALITINAT